MPYCELEDLIGYLNQFNGQPSYEPQLAVLESCLNRASAIINLEIGTSTDLTAAAAGTRVLYGDGGLWLSSDEPMSDVTAVTPPSGYTVPSYVLQDGRLRITTSTGLLTYPYYPTLGAYYSLATDYAGVWAAGVPYTVAATFGYSDTVMTALEEANLQIAVRLWRFRDSGGVGVVGNAEAAVEVQADWTPMVARVLEAVKRERTGDSVGVW